MHISVLLLAAGQSSRFGSNKLLARLDDGRSVIECSMSSLCAEPENVTFSRYVVAGDAEAYGAIVGQFLDWTFLPLRIDRPAMGKTISRAIQDVTTREVPDGWLIMLADMPKVSPQTVNKLVVSFNGDNIVQPVTDRGDGIMRPGHPVLFSSKFTPLLIELSEDQGARSVIKVNQSSLCQVNVEDKGILLDIDTPEDLIRFC